nr:DoxX family protein [Spelaeicoccus albus]
MTPDPWWPTGVLALVLFADGVMSIRPPRLIRDCLDGVGFPRDWWWVLIVVKFAAAAGLATCIVVPGVALAANVGVVAYFVVAAVAHIKARFLRHEFWLNCLGMLAISLAVLIAGVVA